MIDDGNAITMQTWDTVRNQAGITKTKTEWEYTLDVYHIWIEHTACGDFPTVIEGADGIYQIASAGRESIGYFLDPLKAESHAQELYGALWQDDGRQLMSYEKAKTGRA